MGYLYILEIKNSEIYDDAWSGKINATNDLIEETQKAVVDQITTVKKNVNGKVKKLQLEAESVKAKMNTFKDLIGRLE